MSRQECDREDLMAEAKGFVRRVELLLSGETGPVVAGFRRDGRFSIYFGSDPVYHFDDAGRLQRAFREDSLFRTQGKTLAELRRTRDRDGVALARTDMTDLELARFRDALRNDLLRLQGAIASGECEIRRCVPDEDPQLLEDVAAAVARAVHANGALAPAFSGKT